jgi:hypothetical protein
MIHFYFFPLMGSAAWCWDLVTCGMQALGVGLCTSVGTLAAQPFHL